MAESMAVLIERPDGEVSEATAENEFQIWKICKKEFGLSKDTHIQVKNKLGLIIKDLTYEQKPNGKWQITNAIRKENEPRTEAAPAEKTEKHGCIFIVQ